MPFIPHTPADIKQMLATIGIEKIDDLFSEIPPSLRNSTLENIPDGISEMALSKLMLQRSKLDAVDQCYIGAGAYEHHIPAAVWDIASRGEFLTAYTPYQPEASQGSLQLIYEYQTMMASLMGLQVSNASMYDGASALSEAVLMAVRLQKKKSVILIPKNIHPYYRDVVYTIINQQDISLLDVPYVPETGCVDRDFLANLSPEDITNIAALIIPQPNFLGVIDQVDDLVNWAHEQKMLAIAVVNPLAMALLKPPGQWGDTGADIACGEGQPLGIPLASGGPYYGFLCTKKEFVRQMPGRIVGKTHDTENKEGYVLTLQAREQHIRRGKATSNICTNQGLMVTASTIYMSLMGPLGLRQTALVCHEATRKFAEKISGTAGITKIFTTPFFHEVVLQFQKPVARILDELADKNIQAGFGLKRNFPELGESLLVCITETKTDDEIDLFCKQLQLAVA